MVVSKKRNISLDLMRFLGVFVIMIAHSNPPDWLFQLRNFGTPLLIVASALTYAFIYANRELDPIPFFRKRLSRLIFPAWIFLTFFFLINLLYSRILKLPYPFDGSMIINSYTFYSGIGFVWIFKVYIVLALITPFAFRVNKSIKGNTKYFVILALSYLAYELILYFTTPRISPAYLDFFERVIFVIFPYTILFLYGLRLGSLSSRRIIFSSLAFFVISVGLSVYLQKQTGRFIPTQNYKYPPQLYYLSYALFATNIIYLFCRRFAEKINPNTIIWLSSKSLWIYLWHIFAYFLLDALVPSDKLLLLSVVKSIFLFGFGIIATLIQGKLVNKYLMPSSSNFVRRIGEFLL